MHVESWLQNHLRGGISKELPEGRERTTKGRKRDTLGASRPKKGHPTSVVGMPPRGSKAPAKPTSKLIAHNFLPTSTKPQEVVGSFIVMPGREWAGCPSADKEKLFKCVVPKFVQAWEAAGCRPRPGGDQRWRRRWDLRQPRSDASSHRLTHAQLRLRTQAERVRTLAAEPRAEVCGERSCTASEECQTGRRLMSIS